MAHQIELVVHPIQCTDGCTYEIIIPELCHDELHREVGFSLCHAFVTEGERLQTRLIRTLGRIMLASSSQIGTLQKCHAEALLVIFVNTFEMREAFTIKTITLDERKPQNCSLMLPVQRIHTVSTHGVWSPQQSIPKQASCIKGRQMKNARMKPQFRDCTTTAIEHLTVHKQPFC